MMKDNGGPAFPVQRSGVGGGSSLTGNGMTLRDYFAAQAISGLAANPENDGLAWSSLAESAYEVADKMIEARKK